MLLRATVKVDIVRRPAVNENKQKKNIGKTFRHMSENCEYALQWELVTMCIHSKTATRCQWTDKSTKDMLTTNREFPALGIFARGQHKELTLISL